MVMACRAGHRFQDFMAIELSERNEIYFQSLTMAAVFLLNVILTRVLYENFIELLGAYCASVFARDNTILLFKKTF